MSFPMRVGSVIACGLVVSIVGCSPSTSMGTGTSTPPASPTLDPACPTERLIIVWEQDQGQDPRAEMFGDQNATCRSTLSIIGSSGPAGVAYCIEVALASDNPGYDQDAVPAAPIKKAFATFGPDCH